MCLARYCSLSYSVPFRHRRQQLCCRINVSLCDVQSDGWHCRFFFLCIILILIFFFTWRLDVPTTAQCDEQWNWNKLGYEMITDNKSTRNIVVSSPSELKWQLKEAASSQFVFWFLKSDIKNKPRVMEVVILLQGMCRALMSTLQLGTAVIGCSLQPSGMRIACSAGRVCCWRAELSNQRTAVEGETSTSLPGAPSTYVVENHFLSKRPAL